MKSRFTTIDIVATLRELQSLLGMRLINVYDIDNKTYLFKLSRKEEKAILLAESGIRLQTTDFEWPKNPAPSSFTMKLRKHIHNRRLESVQQVGVDRIVDMQFGSSEAAYHVILELYDKGNLVLTDYQYTILNILRPRTEGEDLKFAVRNVYPVENAVQVEPVVSPERIREIILAAKIGDNLKRVLNPHLIYGPALIEHVLLGAGFNDNVKIGKGFNISEDVAKLIPALEEAERLMTAMRSGDETKGYIIQKGEKRLADKGEMTDFLVYHEFHPFLFRQHESQTHVEFPSFSKAVDEFFSKIESQKIDMKAIHQEKDALKKLENVKKDHDRRINILGKSQEEDKWKAQLIEMNLQLVDKAIFIIQSAIANQVSWKEIGALIQEAQLQGDPVAKAIKTLKLEINHITMLLCDPYFVVDNASGEQNVPHLIDIDLDLTAYANAKKYYDLKRHAAKKEQKTIESSTKAYKSAEKKTKQALKDVAIVTNIKKARKVHWFEKFYWFISSENFLVIGGRDQQQNEIIVKRYLRPGDVYVHADLHGASSIVIKNRNGTEHPIPPKTLNEAGTMAVCYSLAWDAKVVTSAWWVYHDQVSKTAPSGEYLTTGSFMIRGKKNYLPPCHLIMGFGILFKLDEESVPKHKDERKVRANDEDWYANEQIPLQTEAEIPLDEGSDDGSIDGSAVGEADKTLDADGNNIVEKNSGNIDSSSNLPEIKAESEDEEFQSEFPDTEVKLEHVQGEQFLMRHRTISTASGVSSTSQDAQDDVVFLGDRQPVNVNPPTKQLSSKQSHSKKANVSNSAPKQALEAKNNIADQQEKPLSKRGQKFKLKKMKEKYKDQDEGDRQLAMELLQPGGAAKEPKHKKNKKGSQKTLTKPSNLRPSADSTVVAAAINGHQDLGNNYAKRIMPNNAEPDAGQVSDEEKEKTHSLEDAILMDSLTGLPLSDDILLYGIPVCGPYNSISNYKFKVKLTPGTGKRGKAAKTAIAMHLHDKSATSREKDLIKSLKDQDVSRNIPGKVKMSASQAAYKK